MTDGERAVYRIGMVGPSRVGKTSLITALLEDGRRILAGTPVSMNAVGTPTQRRLNQLRKELNGALLAGEFVAGAIKGNQDPFTFRLALDPGVPGAGIDLEILDYPGGWLAPDTRPPGAEAQWDDCKRFLQESTVLIVPIDAAVLMEATSPAHKRSVPSILATTEVADTVHDWCKERNLRPEEPALLLLCPVKCESYFIDNGGRSDSAAELRAAVLRNYRETLDTLKRETAKVRTMQVVYCPIDTLGCVEIVHTEWSPDPDQPGTLSFEAHYGVRPPFQRSIRGTEDMLTALCRQLVDARQRVEKEEASAAQDAASRAQEIAVRDEGFFRNIWYTINGERRLRHEAAQQRSDTARLAADRVEALGAVVNDLGTREYGPRVEVW